MALSDAFSLRVLAFLGAAGENTAPKVKDEAVEDSVRWTLKQLKIRLPAMVKQAGYDEIAEKIDQQALSAMLFALCHSVEAQQPTKIPRIGYLARIIHGF